MNAIPIGVLIFGKAEEHNYTEGEDKEEHEPEPEYYNTFEIKTKHLRIEDILTTIQTLEKDNNKEFEREFKVSKNICMMMYVLLSIRRRNY